MTQLLTEQIDRAVMHYHGVKHLWLFGSMARGDQSVDSDIDLIYEYDASLDQSFASIYGLYPILEEQFHRKIDLASINCLHPNVKNQILSSMVQIF